MKVPREDAVRFVIKSVLKRSKAGSQEELAAMVNAELRNADPEYAVSEKRAREIAVSMDDVRVEVLVRKGKMPSRCPSCGSHLKKTYSRNLKGRKIIEKMACQRCGYAGHDGKWLPMRYIFTV